MKKVSINQRELYWIRRKLEALHIPRRPFKRPIFIFSTRRSGSTLLTEIIHSQKGVNYSGQPLDFWRYHPYPERLPQPYLNKFISLEPEEEQKLKDFFHDLLAGRIRVRSQWNILNASYSFVVDRMVVKLLNCKPLIDWFAERFDGDIVYLIRHPIPTALSIIRRNWGCTAEAFLQNDHFRHTYLDEAKAKECHHILEYGSTLQKYVLEWGLENLVPLSVFQERSWLTVTYEELIARPAPMCRLLATRLDLSDPERMIQRMSRPSKTTQARSKVDIVEKGSTYLLERWRDEIDPQAAREAMEMLEDLCNVSVYAAESPFPLPGLCHFGPLRKE